MADLKPNTYIYLKFSEAKKHIKEADILLYRGKGLISFFIQRADEGKYSHVGIATWYCGNGDPILETSEFREGKGGRTINLENEVKKRSGSIDVFRPADSMFMYEYDKKSNDIIRKQIDLNPKKVTNNMRRMAGLPYGWKRIWWIAKHKIFGLRLLYNMEEMTSDAKITNDVYPVCSTAVAKSFHAAGIDMTHQKSDEFMSPSDIAKSCFTHYLFTLIAD